MGFEIIKFILYSAGIVFLSKMVLAPTIRKLATILQLKPKTVGNLSGYATSMPELLTTIASSSNGLIGTSIYNIFSSNVINLLLYLATIITHKNTKKLRNKGIRINLILVILTIFIPLLVIKSAVEVSIGIVPIFMILLIIFKIMEVKVHHQYLNFDEPVTEEQQTQEKLSPERIGKVVGYGLILLVVAFFLFVIGELLGETLEVLCLRFHISELFMGSLLGMITSIPELMTFFEAQKHHSKNENQMLGVVEATNNLLTSNVVNLFVIQSIGLILYYYVTR